MIKENYDYRAYRDAEPYDSEVSHNIACNCPENHSDDDHYDQVEVRDREDCGSYTEGMSGTDSYEGQVPASSFI